MVKRYIQVEIDLTGEVGDDDRVEDLLAGVESLCESFFGGGVITELNVAPGFVSTVEVEKLLCARLGIEWDVMMSVVSLADKFAQVGERTKALEYAAQVEREIMEVANGERKPSMMTMRPIGRLIEYVRNGKTHHVNLEYKERVTNPATVTHLIMELTKLVEAGQSDFTLFATDPLGKDRWLTAPILNVDEKRMRVDLTPTGSLYVEQ